MKSFSTNYNIFAEFEFQEAYRKWVCSSLVPYFAHRGPPNLEPSEDSWNGRRLRSCRSLCHTVEQRCPYLLPGDRAPAYPTQYAGEPTFLCQGILILAFFFFLLLFFFFNPTRIID